MMLVQGEAFMINKILGTIIILTKLIRPRMDIVSLLQFCNKFWISWIIGWKLICIILSNIGTSLIPK